MTQEEKAIEIPFGAKDSELLEWVYFIPEGMEAEIKDRKVIIKKAESEDERIRKAIVGLIEELQRSDKYFAGVELTDMLAYLERQKEPHYTKRNALFDKCVENCDPTVMKKVSDEVDEMLEKEQKPEGWSEEDKKQIAQIERIIKNAGCSKMLQEKIHNWLKSLRPSWKPSEKQMKALQNAVALTACDKELARLYNQLKKL